MAVLLNEKASQHSQQGFVWVQKQPSLIIGYLEKHASHHKYVFGLCVHLCADECMFSDATRWRQFIRRSFT